MPTADDALPLYLRTPGDFRAFISEHFDPLSTVQRGERFADAALTFLRGQEWTEEFPNIRLNSKKSGELGRDIVSDSSAAGAVLWGEAKYSLEGVEQLDGVLSKWHELESQLVDQGQAGHPPSLFEQDEIAGQLPQFVLLAGVSCGAIIRRFEAQTRASKAFYDRLRESDRLHIYDLDEIYRWARASYLRQHGIPTDFTLTSDRAWSSFGNVLLGAIEGSELVRLVDDHGEALFFENIRGWLGDSGQVNASILQTVREAPAKFLERNNGVTLRVEGLELSEDRREVTIKRGNIVNGCQTTMTIWHARPSDPQLRVQVKIVTSEEEDAWRIAEAANYQNTVTLLELKLAQYLRPQLVSRHASRLGRGLSDQEPNDLQAMVGALTKADTTYQLAKYLFLGLFCRRPNDLFSDNYSKLRSGVISAFYAEAEEQEEMLFQSLFLLMERGRLAIEKASSRIASKEHTEPFTRVFQDTGTKYQAFVLLLTVSAALEVDLSAREEDDEAEAKRLRNFVMRSTAVLDDEPDRFETVCRWALNTLFNEATRDDDDPRKIKQYLYGRIEEGAFTRFYTALTRSLDML